MSIVSQKTETVPIDAVRPHPKNPRKGDVPVIVESMRVNGFYGTLIAQRSSGYILAGNHRHRAAVELGLTEVPVTWVDVDDDTALNILLVDNRSADLGDYDNAKLLELLQGRSEVDDELSGTGYNNAFLVGMLKRLDDGGGERSDRTHSRSGSGGTKPESTPDGEPGGDTAGNPSGYVPQLGVLVLCEDKEEQGDVQRRLEDEGYNVRKITT